MNNDPERSTRINDQKDGVLPEALDQQKTIMKSQDTEETVTKPVDSNEATIKDVQPRKTLGRRIRSAFGIINRRIILIFVEQTGSMDLTPEISTFTKSIGKIHMTLKRKWYSRDFIANPILSSIASEPHLRIYVGTWNMHGELPSENLEPFLPHPTTDVHIKFHIIALGTQECSRSIEASVLFPSKELWEKQLVTYLSPQYKLLKTETLNAIHLAVFIVSDLFEYCYGNKI